MEPQTTGSRYGCQPWGRAVRTVQMEVLKNLYRVKLSGFFNIVPQPYQPPKIYTCGMGDIDVGDEH